MIQPWRRQLLPGRKAMTHLDSVLKSKDVTLPTKVHIVKATVFSVVTYGCESWTINEAECWRVNAFKLWCWRRLLGVVWTVRRSNQSILKEINSEYTLEELMMKLNLQYSVHLMWRADSLEKTLILGKIEGRNRREQQRMRCLDDITDSRDMNLGKLWEMVRDRVAWCAAVHRTEKSWTRLGDWTTTITMWWLPKFYSQCSPVPCSRFIQPITYSPCPFRCRTTLIISWLEFLISSVSPPTLLPSKPASYTVSLISGNSTLLFPFQKNIYLFIYLAMLGLICCRGTLCFGLLDLVPWPGVKPRPPSLGAQGLSHWTTREVPILLFPWAKILESSLISFISHIHSIDILMTLPQSHT